MYCTESLRLCAASSPGSNVSFAECSATSTDPLDGFGAGVYFLKGSFRSTGLEPLVTEKQGLAHLAATAVRCQEAVHPSNTVMLLAPEPACTCGWERLRATVLLLG